MAEVRAPAWIQSPRRPLKLRKAGQSVYSNSRLEWIRRSRSAREQDGAALRTADWV